MMSIKTQIRNNRSLTIITITLIIAFLSFACSDSTSAAEEERNQQQFDLVLQSNGQSVGTVVTEDSLEGDDTLTSNAFFVTITITDSGFTQPMTVYLDHSNGRCGIGNVFSEERRDLPCTYDLFLDENEGFRVIADDGDGDVAILDL